MEPLNLEPTKTKRAGCEPSAPKKVEQTESSPKRTKEHVILCALRNGSLNRFEAERIGDHCLHSTVSTLAHKCGLEFDRAWESVPTRFGVAVRVKRYWLAAPSLEAADRILAMATGEARND
jgi:hypothetical protein